MSANNAVQDENYAFSLLVADGTTNTSQPMRVLGSNGAVNVVGYDSFISKSFDNISASYPNGTVEVYQYKSGTTAVGTVTVTYTDATKGSISTVTGY